MCRDRVLADRGFVNYRELPTGPNGRPLCRYCHKETTPPRKTFCSDLCVQEHKIRSNPGYAREQVYLRDKGVCRTCNLDTEKLQGLLLKIRQKSTEAYYNLVLHYELKYGYGFRLGEHFWEADHIHPVAEGGGCCGLDNYQSLCRACHLRKTRQQLVNKSHARHRGFKKRTGR